MMWHHRDSTFTAVSSIWNRGPGCSRRNDYQQIEDKEVDIQLTLDGIPIRKLFITNISIEVKLLELKGIFGGFGRIRFINMAVSKIDHKKQYAFITYFDPKDAALVLSNHSGFQDVQGRTMFAVAAGSWHQPLELPDGTIDWKDEEKSADDTHSRAGTEISKGSLNILNDDCLMLIFSFLSFKEITFVETVCKRWQAVSYCMWRCLQEINFRKEGSFSNMPCNTKALDQYLMRCGSSLTTLDLMAKHHAFSENTLVVVAKHCENLEVLRVNNIVVANNSLSRLGNRCPKLNQFVMEGCKDVTDNDLNRLLSKCPDLKELDLRNIDGLTGEFLENVKGPVTSLRLSELYKLHPPYLLQGLKNMGQTLKSVILSTCKVEGYRSVDVKDVIDAVPNLTSFSLSNCRIRYDIDSLSALGQLKKLTSLNLHFNRAVNDSVLTAIVEGCEELTSLNLNGSGGRHAGERVSERGLSVLSGLHKLTGLNISHLEATTNTALKNFTAGNCNLKILVCRGCPQLNDEGTEIVITSCNQLELFDVSGCHNVTSKTVETALTAVKMRNNNNNNILLRVIVGGTQINPPFDDDDDEELIGDFIVLSKEQLNRSFADDEEPVLIIDFIDSSKKQINQSSADNEVILLTVDFRDLSKNLPRLWDDDKFFYPIQIQPHARNEHYNWLSSSSAGYHHRSTGGDINCLECCCSSDGCACDGFGGDCDDCTVM